MVYLQDGRLLKRFVFVGPKTNCKELHRRQRWFCRSKSQDLVPHQWYQHPNVRPGWKHGSGLTLKKLHIYSTVKPVYNGHPWDLKKVAV